MDVSIRWFHEMLNECESQDDIIDLARTLHARIIEFEIGLDHFYRLGYGLQSPENMREAKLPESVIAYCTALRKREINARL